MSSEVFEFAKEGQVSVWYSDHPYADVPDSYFEEDSWAKNFNLGVYDIECLETNGAESGVMDIDVAVGQCSYSKSYVDKVVKKIKKMGSEKVTWIVLMFDYEYRPKKTKIHKDEYLNFVGAYPYDSTLESLFEVEE